MPSPYDPRPHPGPWADNRLRVRRTWAVPLHFLEWLTRLLAYYLSHWSLLEVLEYVGRFTVLVAVIIYFAETSDRRKQKHYQAWQVINSAYGVSGNGGRVEALEELSQDGVSLAGVDVSKAFLRGVRLGGADLHYSTMRACDLRDADFRRANLAGADVSHSNLRGADLRRAAAAGADLSDADLNGADLTGADLAGADLRRADLRGVRWGGATSLKLANVYGVEHAPEGFLPWAMSNGAVSLENSDAWETSKDPGRPGTKPTGG